MARTIAELIRLPVFSVVVQVIGGVVTASFAAELALRLVASSSVAPVPRIERDTASDIRQTHREMDEGIGVSHFSPAGARLTNGTWLDRAGTVVFVGDSYVAAVSVADAQTMGAYFERFARAADVAVNVRQYGWSGASPAQYLLAAPSILARWNPAAVVIPMANNDLDFNAVTEASPGVRVTRGTSLQIVRRSAVSPNPQTVQQPSTLRELARHRWSEIEGRLPAWARVASASRAPGEFSVEQQSRTPPDSTELANLPRAVVRALGQAYGPRVVLLYLAEVPLSGDASPSDLELRFLAACNAEHVRCASTREAMIRARDAGHVTRGFNTTAPNNGHLNAWGHEATANVAWSVLGHDLALQQYAQAR